MDDLVTIIIAAQKDKTAQLNETVNSALDQSYPNVEVIILSNEQKLESKLSRKWNPNLKHIYFKKAYLPDMFEKGIEQSSGKYIGILDSSNILTKKSISDRVEGIKDKGICFGNIRLMDDTDVMYASIKYPQMKLKEFTKMVAYSKLNHNSMLINKQSIIDVGVYNKEYNTEINNDLIIRIARKYGYNHVDQIVCESKENQNINMIYKQMLINKYLSNSFMEKFKANAYFLGKGLYEMLNLDKNFINNS